MKTLICLSLVSIVLLCSSCRGKKANDTTETVQITETAVELTDHDTMDDLELETKNIEFDKEEILFTPPSDAFEIRIEYFEGNDRVIKDSGIHVTLEWPGSIMYAWANEKQLEFLRNNGVEAYGKWEWRESNTFEQNMLKTTKEHELIKDPYRSAWDKEFSDMTMPGLYRFYKDFNGDGNPELILPIWGGSQGTMHLIFKIVPNGYYYLGSIFCWSFQSLPKKTNGFFDIVVRSYGELSCLYYLKFNGYFYEAEKEMMVTMYDLLESDIFQPDEHIEWEKHVGDELQWSPRDDDKYR
jgi:hypothetical protein